MNAVAKKPQSPTFLPYGRQSINQSDIDAVAEVLRSDYLTTGPTVARFEEAYAETVGAERAVACSNGTAALHLSSLALDIGPDDKVIVPTLTFLATANAPRLAGAEVIFADVDADTGLLTVETFEAALDRAGPDKVKAVFPVHLNGQTADMVDISSFASDKGIRVVEDACHAIGTTYESNGKPYKVGACAHSDLACFSFHPVKTIAMGEGGAVTTGDPELAKRMERLRSHGMVREQGAFTNAELSQGGGGNTNPWYYEMPEIGLNYRASDIHCALGLSQLGRLDSFMEKRRELVSRYDGLLEDLSPVVRPVTRVPGCGPVLHLYAVLMDFAALGKDRREVMNALREKGIGTQVHYIPVHMQPYYRTRYGDIDLPGARSYYERCLSLPLFASMTEEDVDRVVETLAKELGI